MGIAKTATEDEQAQATSIYEDEEVKVIFQPGESNFLLITFGDLLSLANGNNFFAEAPSKKLRLNCIGFMAKRPNWYPWPNISKAITSIESFLSRFTTRICYGGSMGGYAAVKFSRKLNAKATIALCPQWSLDPKECGDTDSGWSKYYTDKMMDMGITKFDTHGNIFVFFDPAHSVDRFHAQKILGLSKTSYAVLTRSADHHVTNIFAGTSNLEQLTKHALANDHQKVVETAGSIRRRHPTRERILLNRLAVHHYKLLDILLGGQNRKIDQEDKNRLNSHVLNKYIQDQNIESAARTIDRLIQLEICATRKKILQRLRQENSLGCLIGNEALGTAHGTTLLYSPATARLSHAAVHADEIRFFIKVRTALSATNGNEYAAITFDGSTYYISVCKNGTIELIKDLALVKDTCSLLAITRDESGIKILKSGLYTSAEKNGSISYNRPTAKGWETFKNQTSA